MELNLRDPHSDFSDRNLSNPHTWSHQKPAQLPLFPAETERSPALLPPIYAAQDPNSAIVLYCPPTLESNEQTAPDISHVGDRRQQLVAMAEWGLRISVLLSFGMALASSLYTRDQYVAFFKSEVSKVAPSTDPSSPAIPATTAAMPAAIVAPNMGAAQHLRRSLTQIPPPAALPQPTWTELPNLVSQPPNPALASQTSQPILVERFYINASQLSPTLLQGAQMESSGAPLIVERIYLNTRLAKPAEQSQAPTYNALQTKASSLTTAARDEASSEFQPNSQTPPSISSPAKLLGILDYGTESVALFQREGVTRPVHLGQMVNGEGWVLAAIDQQKALLQRQGETQILMVGDVLR